MNMSNGPGNLNSQQKLSGTFFQQIEIPAPDLNLDIGSGSHGQQTGEMLIRLESAPIAHSERITMMLAG
jgi:UDP-N-acetylglucosamine 2-epimerase